MDIEANRLPRRRLNKGWKLLGKYKIHVLAILFLELEVMSFVLDLLGRSELVFVLAAFLLSALGFGMTVYTCIKERTIALTRSQAERQLGVVEIAFSAVQLVATFTHFVLVSAGVKENYSTVTLFPIVFSIIVVIFIFRKDRAKTEQAKRHAEMARLRELHTLKGQVESVVKMKGHDIDTIPRTYSV